MRPCGLIAPGAQHADALPVIVEKDRQRRVGHLGGGFESVRDGEELTDERRHASQYRDMSRSSQAETSRSLARARTGIFPAMNEELLTRIQLRLKELGISATAAAKAGGLGADAIRDLKRKPHNSVTLETIRKLASGLQTTPEWLAFDIDNRAPAKPAPEGGLPVIGEVAAGSWQEVHQEAQDGPPGLSLFQPVPVARDPRWPADSQFGLIVRGTSINNTALDGDILACVEWWALKREPLEGELVIVERFRDSGHLMERTAKLFRAVKDAYELWPDSMDPRWEAPIVVPKDLGFDAENSDGIRVNVRAKVVWIHKHMNQPPVRRLPWSATG